MKVIILDKVIDVNNVSKEYKLYSKKSDRLKEAVFKLKRQYYIPFYALRGISFDVEKCETIGIIGSNGSGKSTLLKIITGVTTPSQGEVFVEGRVSALLELGAGFNMEYTGIENIELQCKLAGVSKEEMPGRKQKIIDFAEINEYINQPVKNYSSGMFARLAFAVAISVDPDILIVDEALSVGDVFFQNKCFRKFEELKRLGTTILLISHDLNTVRKMCNRVLWIEKGEQIAFGEANEVCDKYFNEQITRLSEYNRSFAENIELIDNPLTSSEGKVEEVPAISPNNDSIFSDEAAILSVYVVDDSQRIVKNIIPNKHYSVVVISKYYKKMSNVIVGFVMKNSKGVSILGSNTFIDSGGNGINVDRDVILKSSFEFLMPQIQGGAYEISPAVAIGTQKKHVNLTWVNGVCDLNVERGEYELFELRVDAQIRNEVLKDVIIH